MPELFIPRQSEIWNNCAGQICCYTLTKLSLLARQHVLRVDNPGESWQTVFFKQDILKRMRSYIRHPSDIPIEYTLETASDNTELHMKNVSHGGLSFNSSAPIGTGKILRLRIAVVQPAFEAEGLVVWCREEAGHYRIGIQFTHEQDIFTARMVEQICHIEQYRKKMCAQQGREVSSKEAALEWIKLYAGKFPELASDK